ncbi:hypothetical protein ACI6Q2_13885 [Chitinophagaceae bacterium LWZ2-11]
MMRIKIIAAIVMMSICFTGITYGQTLPGQAAAKNPINAVNDANSLKTGNWQDVLTSFFQLGLNDLTGPNRSFNFKSSLFGLKLKTNPGLNVDTEYIKHTFDRNFQFNVALRLDDSYKFNGFSAGFTWAAVNKRDTTLISFANTDISKVWENTIADLSANMIAYRNMKLALNTQKDKDDYLNAKAMLDRMMDNGNIVPDSFPSDFKKTAFASLNAIYHAYDSVKQATRLKGLLTFSLNSAFTQQSRFDSAQFGVVYLQGITHTGKSLELDMRANISYKDTTIGTDKYRSILNSSAGLNYALISNKKTKMSILEVKPYFAYNRIFGAVYAGEKAEMFTANADVRIRVTPSIWIPLTLKYDLKQGNLFGFINVAINMNALKKSSS